MKLQVVRNWKVIGVKRELKAASFDVQTEQALVCREGHMMCMRLALGVKW